MATSKGRASTAPLCELCKARHWSYELHVFTDQPKEAPSRSVQRRVAAQKDEPIPEFLPTVPDILQGKVLMDKQNAEEYTQALGQVFGGGWRLIWTAEKLGVPEALGISTREWVEQRLGGYVRLSMSERRVAVKELSEDGLTTREMGDLLGVSHQTVANDTKPTSVKNFTEEQVQQAQEPPTSVKNFTEEQVSEEPLPQNTIAAAAYEAGEEQRLRRVTTANISLVLSEIRRWLVIYPEGEINVHILREIEHLESLAEKLEDGQ